MKGARVVGLRPAALKAQMLKNYIETQKKLLIDYAERKVAEIGDAIKKYHSANHMDKTHNLLDSLCWGVSYEGKLLKGGFYRSKQATESSYLHERSVVTFFDKKYKKSWVDSGAYESVDGHQLAQDYLQSYGNNGTSGWRVFFAILAPYWGYWEKGFTMKGAFGDNFVRFAVMTQFYDQVKADLKPMRTRFRVSVAKYASKSLYSRAKKNFNPQND